MNSSPSFILAATQPWKDLGGGVSRQVLGYNANLMIVQFQFRKGGIGAPHHHIHSQSAVVQSGLFELTINGEKKVLGPGDGYFVEPNIEHSAVCLEDGVLVDAFSPARMDFL